MLIGEEGIKVVGVASLVLHCYGGKSFGNLPQWGWWSLFGEEDAHAIRGRGVSGGLGGFGGGGAWWSDIAGVWHCESTEKAAKQKV